MKLTEFEFEVAKAIRDRRDPWKVGRGAGQAIGRLVTKGIVVHNGAQSEQGERFKLTAYGAKRMATFVVFLHRTGKVTEDQPFEHYIDALFRARIEINERLAQPGRGWIPSEELEACADPDPDGNDTEENLERMLELWNEESGAEDTIRIDEVK